MKIAPRIVAALLIACGSSASHAQVPAIIGTWKLNAEASTFSSCTSSTARGPESDQGAATTRMLGDVSC